MPGLISPALSTLNPSHAASFSEVKKRLDCDHASSHFEERGAIVKHDPLVEQRSAAEKDDLLNETRVLQRRVNFWQRTVWLLLGTVVVFGTVIWQRGELRRKQCRLSLQRYAQVAKANQLESQNSAILEQQWQQLIDEGIEKVPSIHYDLIVKNWHQTPKPGEMLPLAVCREPHFMAMSRGRHVLYRDVDGFRVEWRSEERAEPIVLEAAADNHTH